eukprot:CAMPEP_0184665836 /NCGR_PEP_ID=MMETSP0308-20130426/58867_1 /TAXON_ID=38269 /ORGANISM="Gloeochaete witrockiana, Strain SAG 46.84" /LENGTH=421 /DNA_ID=CAMNT_0027110081 /DNA_START=139 /DNA_END=1404 /DNA_ORIENTATION=-
MANRNGFFVVCSDAADPSQIRIVITGLGLVTPLGNDVDDVYYALTKGKSGVTSFEHSLVRNGARITGEEILEQSSIQYAKIASKSALEHAKITEDVLAAADMSRWGVIVGTSEGGSGSEISGALAKDTGVAGTVFSISCGASSGAAAIITAADHIRAGKAEVMICGGSEAPFSSSSANVLEALYAAGVLANGNGKMDASALSRPWDQDRCGVVLGEGAGILVLEELEHATARGAPVYAEYLGGNISFDHKGSQESSNLASTMLRALDDAALSVEEVDYINANACSSPTTDAIEIGAIREIIPESRLEEVWINSTKSLIGHSLGASGAIEAITSIKALTTGIMHPTANLINGDACLTGLNVVGVKAKVPFPKIKTAISNSFSLGSSAGSNATIVFAAYRNMGPVPRGFLKSEALRRGETLEI